MGGGGGGRGTVGGVEILGKLDLSVVKALSCLILAANPFGTDPARGGSAPGGNIPPPP